jgi:hypothetical protein
VALLNLNCTLTGSSAHFFNECCKKFSILYMYCLKGPSIEPWGTLNKIFFFLTILILSSTYYFSPF